MEPDDEPDDGTTAEEPPPDAEPVKAKKKYRERGSRSGVSVPTAYSSSGRRVHHGHYEGDEGEW